MKYYEFCAMNTTILLGAVGDTLEVETGFQQAEAQIREHEQRFTRFSETSELAELNRSAGNWFAISPEMFKVLQLAAGFYWQTGGLFNPAILPALEQTGYDRSMEIIRAEGGHRPASVGRPGPVPDFRLVQFDAARRSVRLPPGMRLDLGGIGKGWIAEQAALCLGQYSSACLVDAGGDMFAVGRPGEGQDWMVALEDPIDSSRNLAVLSVGPGAVATSTITRRHWLQGGRDQHHLIDPRTGQPARTFWISVTVLAPHAALAEVLAKSLLITGPDGVQRLIDKYPAAVYLAVDRNGKLWGSKNSQEVLYANIQTVE